MSRTAKDAAINAANDAAYEAADAAYEAAIKEGENNE